MNNTYDTIHAHAFGARVRAGGLSIPMFLGRLLRSFTEARACSLEIKHLNARSDAQLARMGLQRSDIPRHVSKKILGL